MLLYSKVFNFELSQRFVTLWTQLRLIFFLSFHVSKANFNGIKASISRRALQDVNLFFHPLQELCVQLFAQLEKDTKGSEEEAAGKGWYQFACLHKVRERHLVPESRKAPVGRVPFGQK